MSVAKTAIKGASWLAFSRVISQAISWGATILVTRLLVPEDYGVMEMATMLTGYVVLISEMGFGAAIVQRDEVSPKELSSVFWFLFGWGIVLGAICIALSYPTAHIFKNNETIHLTQCIGLVYLSSVLMIVPRNLLLKELRFKALGFYEGLAIVVSCLSMVVLAYSGAGVWTLIGGHIIRESAKFLLFLYACKWTPLFYYKFSDVRNLLTFGISVAIGNSLDYVINKSDRFFCGKFLGDQNLGFYAIGLQFAQLANEKVVSLINSVGFPVLSKYKDDPEKTKIFFLKLVQAIAFTTAPIFFGLAVVADTFIDVLLGSKWIPAVFPMQMLCISQFLIAISTPLAPLNVASGRPRWTMNVNIIAAILMPPSFFISSKFGLQYVAIPWIIIAPIYRVTYLVLTLRVSSIKLREYFEQLLHPILASFVMVGVVLLFKFCVFRFSEQNVEKLVGEVAVGAVGYISYLGAIRKRIVSTVREVWEI